MQITISFFILDFVSLEKYLSNSDFFQISRLQMAKNYRPKNCYQNTTHNQSSKSEILSTAKLYQMLQFIKREQVSFFLFVIFANELQDVTAYGLRSDFLSPEIMPKATVELALTKNRKLLLACMLAKVIYFLVMSITPKVYLYPYLINASYPFTIFT